MGVVSRSPLRKDGVAMETSVTGGTAPLTHTAAS